MERPQHDLVKLQTKSAQSRLGSIVIVAIIHVLIITALVIGLTNNAIKNKIMDISASVVAKHVITAAPPPPPVQIVRPPPVAAAPPPQIVISAPPPAVVKPVVAAPPPPPPPTELKEITRTHTIPPYPALSQRMGESGTTGLSCEIEVTGKVSSCKVEKSSGSGRLDEAASSYVKDHYTWQPPTREGKPVTATAHLNIVWDLKNAQ